MVIPVIGDRTCFRDQDKWGRAGLARGAERKIPGARRGFFVKRPDDYSVL
jgi:hypothetical protein